MTFSLVMGHIDISFPQKCLLYQQNPPLFWLACPCRYPSISSGSAVRTNQTKSPSTSFFFLCLSLFLMLPLTSTNTYCDLWLTPVSDCLQCVSKMHPVCLHHFFTIHLKIYLKNSIVSSIDNCCWFLFIFIYSKDNNNNHFPNSWGQFLKSLF